MNIFVFTFNISSRGTWYKVHFCALRISLWFLELTHRCDTSTGACQSPELSLRGYTGNQRKPSYHPVFLGQSRGFEVLLCKQSLSEFLAVEKDIEGYPRFCRLYRKKRSQLKGKNGIQTKGAFTSNVIYFFLFLAAIDILYGKRVIDFIPLTTSSGPFFFLW